MESSLVMPRHKTSPPKSLRAVLPNSWTQRAPRTRTRRPGRARARARGGRAGRAELRDGDAGTAARDATGDCR